MHAKKTLFLAPLLLAAGAVADEHRYPLAPAYAAECGSCHVAYPPALLTAPGWAATMRGLDRHFGVDASLDEQGAREIGAILQAQASTRGKHEATGQPPRLSETAWFRKEHRTEKLRRGPAQTAPDAALARCDTCHARAAQGDFGESSLRRRP